MLLSSLLIALAQTTASLDAGVSFVRYDGFLGSAAMSLAPALRWEAPTGRGFLTARGTYLRFESGNRSIDGAISGAWLAPLSRRWRMEVAAGAGASDYARIASFAHGLGEARLHFVGARHGAWLGAAAGRASFGDGGRDVGLVSAGGWMVRRDATLLLSADRSFVGDTAYSDVRASARVYRGSLMLDGSSGARFWSRGGGRGVYAEASATMRLGAQWTLVVAGGRYPTDVVSGSIAGRFATVVLRFGTRTTPRRAEPQLLAYRWADSREARMEVTREGRDSARLLIYTSAANSVEIAADFTQWEPVALHRLAPGVWQAPMRIIRGLHRINVRIDAGAWRVPAGTTRVSDDYGGEVGVFVVP